jgi:hypothetical protein
MISNINITDQGGGQFEVDFHTDITNVSAVLVRYGADAGYGLVASGSATPNANGGNDCSVPMFPGMGSFHFECVCFSADTGAEDDSPDQSYPPVSGGTQDASATLSGLVATSVALAWNSSDPGMGSVSYQRSGDATWLQASDDSGISSTAHQVTLQDLIGSSTYAYTFSTDFDDPSLTDVTSSQASFSTPADPSSGDKPGKVAVSASPAKIKVGDSSVISVQILKNDGSPQAGIPVAFSLGAGQADGNLSAASGTTDAKGSCQVSFSASALPAGRKRARRFVVALAGDPSGKQKRRRALVVVTKA